MSMYKLLFFFLVSITTINAQNQSVSQSENLERNFVLLETADLNVTLATETEYNMFVDAYFENVEQNLVIEANEMIHSILVYNNNDVMEFMLPVTAKSVTLGRSMFESGEYKLAFNFEETEELVSAFMAMR